MGYFRFRRSIKIAPGVRVNLGKTGASVSLGGHGVTHTIGPKGSRTTIGIPGTGVSYTQTYPHGKPPMPSVPQNPAVGPSQRPVTAQKPASSKFFYGIGIALLVIWLLSKVSEQNQSSSLSSHSASPAIPLPSQTFAPTTPIPSYSPSRTRGYAEPMLQVSPLPKYTQRLGVISPTAIPRALPVVSPYNSSSTATPSALVQTANALDTLQPTPTTTPTPSIGTYRVVNIYKGDTLSLREGPGSTYRIIAQIPSNGRGIRFYNGRVANGPTIWRQISVGGYTGWANEIYLESESLTH
jgi:hypothetical protein